MANKLTKQKYSPVFFNIDQDIIGSLPVKLVERWLDSNQDEVAALELLKAYQVVGYSVSSDAAGFTKLFKHKGLLETLAIINQPKEIIYSLGKGIGGQGLGIWAADNTQMFYPATVSATTLISALLTMQDEINKTCLVKVGLGAHYGEFYAISGGLYGQQADAIEEIAENETDGGEIVISQAIYELLPPDHGFAVDQRTDMSAIIGNIYRVTDGPRLGEIPPVDRNYPIPYSDSFYADLLTYQNCLGDQELGNRLTEKYIQTKTVVLVEHDGHKANAGLVSIFDGLSLSALLKDEALLLLSNLGGTEVKVVGNFGIYIFEDSGAAIEFAQALRQALTKQAIACRIGIDVGPVLVFDLATGGKDIAGMPVNVASKMAQDKGQFGKIYLSAALKNLAGGFNPITYTVSGIDITAYEG